jgi:hypothetical protein
MDATRGKNVAVATLGAVAIASAVLAGSTVWLLMTQPVAVATAVADGGVAQALVVILRTVIVALARFV